MTLLRILCQLVALPLCFIGLGLAHIGGTNEAEKETWR